MSVTATQSPSAATTVAQASSSAAKPGAGGTGAATFDALLTQLRGSGAAATGTASETGGTASADETEDRFLKLLVAQMRNQDPLNPADNAQITSQMAQINTVKGIDKLNTELAKLVERSTAGSATEAASMVGRSVLVEGDTMTLAKDGTAKAGFELGTAATGVEVEVLDAKGGVVDSRSLGALPAGLQTFEWDGRTGSTTAPPGAYRIRVTAVNGNDAVGATTLAAAPVQAVTRGTAGVSLQLGPFGSRSLDDVKAIL
ncbi:MAG: flagellar hook assembly protein [Pseudomonadota bacterium]|jgi:flagellar basal-body rod modification protein FlgD